MDKKTRVHQLIERIDSGRVSLDEVKKQIQEIEKKYGSLDLLYDVDDRTDQSYYEDLLCNARLGIYNKESLLKMAEIKLTGVTSKRITTTKAVVIGSALLVIVIAGIIIAICRR